MSTWPDVFLTFPRPFRYVILIAAGIGALFYFKILPFGNPQADSCAGEVTVIGTLLDSETQSAVKGVTVHLGTFEKDPVLVDGKFMIEGFELPKSKKVPLTVEFPNGDRQIIEEFDLGNHTRYPLKENCTIDLKEVYLKSKGARPAGGKQGGKYEPDGPDRDDNTPAKNRPGNPMTATPVPPPKSAEEGCCNSGAEAGLAILVADSPDYSASNLKNALTRFFRQKQVSTTTSLIRPGMVAAIAKKSRAEDIAALKMAGIADHVKCLCFVQPKVQIGQTEYEGNAYQKAEGNFEVKFFAFSENEVTAFTADVYGAGGSPATALERLHENLLDKFTNQHFPLSSCKN